MEWLECASLTRLPWLLHAFSTRRGGVSRAPPAGLNLGFTQGDRRTKVEENRALFFRALGAGCFTLAELSQIHSAKMYQVVSGEPSLDFRPSGCTMPESLKGMRPEGDALLTDQAGILLSARTADCLPVLLVDPVRRAVAAVHAGWRGALERILEKAVGEMRRMFGSIPRNLLAAVGPCIRACCYEVGEEIVNHFCGRFPGGEGFFQKAPGPKTSAGLAARYSVLLLSAKPSRHAQDASPTVHLDLVAVARDELQSAGVLAAKIQVAEFCTACRSDLFFSHRKEGRKTGRMMAVVGIRPS